MTSSRFTADRRQLLALAAAIPAMGLARAPGAPAHPAIRAMVDRYVADRKVANMLVAIGGGEGPPSYVAAGTFELGSGPIVGPDTLYRLYSMTKPITACAIMMLVEQGKLALDTPLSEIFPSFARSQVLIDPAKDLAVRPATRLIRIRHLVTHTAGLAYANNAPAPLAALYDAQAKRFTDRLPGATAAEASTLIPFAEAAGSLPLLFEPGSQWHYSIGLDVAGAVVEKVSGEPFDSFLAKHIFTPLGMTDTAFTVPAAKLGRLAAHYSYRETGLALIETGSASAWAHPPRRPSGGGGLVGSARDYTRFLAMLLHEGRLGGVRILKTETARTMMSDLLEPGTVAHITSGDSGYGAGGRVVVDAKPGGEGLGTYGWSGAANTVAFVDRANALYVVLMTQVMQWPGNSIFRDLDSALYADLARA